MDKKYNDIIIQVDDTDFRKLYRGVTIKHIVFNPDTVEISLGENGSIIDQRVSILKVKGLKLIIE